MNIEKIEQIIDKRADEILTHMAARKERNMEWIDEKNTEAIKALAMLMMVTEIVKVNESQTEYTLK